MKAVRILEHEFEQDDVLSFDRISDNASRAGAATFFNQLLYLGSRDIVHMEQKEAYADISITAKPKLADILRGLDELAVNEQDADATIAGEVLNVPTPTAARA